MGLFDKLKDMFSGTADLYAKEDAPALTPAQQRGLALGADYAVEGVLPINALTVEADARTAAKPLAAGWDVRGADDVERTYELLLTQGHRGYYAIAMPKVEELYSGRLSRRDAKGAAEQHAAQVRQEATARGLDPERAVAFYQGWSASAQVGGHGELADPLPPSIAAWDAARVVHVSRLAVDAGFVAPERAWAAIEEAVVMSRPAYASWAQFGDGFLAGRAFWSAGNRTPVDQDLPDFKRAVRRLLDTESSPWRTLSY
ncbi:DUF1266 domain-containing protein [Cellulosimicrobium sp. I38E]|uniref:DUF1266 domain-containing protein n=1 Tax=Cellulosimicrobium sp. I38E TaxID=1393139 RepID=UPI0007B1D3CD|nr:DUF1266 domain-containing protein [Cellulosimicrobium sp. I38E]KZM78908.1 hypothetical protein A0J59_01445 [Cellulosimicrobium sp. I38E]